MYVQNNNLYGHQQLTAPDDPWTRTVAWWQVANVMVEEAMVANATVANAAAKSSIKTVNAKKISELPTQAKAANKRFVDAISIPDKNIALIKPIRTANSPPNNVNITVVSHPIPFEYKAMSVLENPISL